MVEFYKRCPSKDPQRHGALEVSSSASYHCLGSNNEFKDMLLFEFQSYLVISNSNSKYFNFQAAGVKLCPFLIYLIQTKCF